jgi:hypothetical protein
MLDRLRTLFGKGGKPVSQEIEFEDLPSYIKNQEEVIRKHLENEVTVRRPQVIDAIDALREILDSLSEIERTPSSHPKLEKIAQSSLPHFIRSFQQHLNRTLPPDPDSFYHEVSALLKGCITTMRGAGKYLPAVFPDEMKALRQQIGIIGRTMNELTAVFSQAKKEREELSSLRDTWSTIRSLREEQTKREARTSALRTQAQTVQEEGERVQQSLQDLQNSTAYGDLLDQQNRLASLKEEIRNLRLQKEQALGVVLSVYRRSARIARHQNNHEMEKEMEASIEQLESSSRDCDQIRTYLGHTLPRIMELIQDGTLSLKGQDEQRIFSDPEITIGEVYRSCWEMRNSEERLEEREQEIRKIPVQAEFLRLKGEEGRILHSSEKILQELAEEEATLGRLPERIQTLTEELRQQIPEVFKGECAVILMKLEEPKKE